MKKFKISTVSAIAVCALVAVVLFGCTSLSDFDKGKKQLEQQGYTDVKNTDYNFFCCDVKDAFSTGFECKDKNGNIVKGCFCSNVLKGVTIRFE
jgi:hypothetical protein